MELILWRHAEAEDSGPRGDLSRALTRRGLEQAARVGRWLDTRLPPHALILASPARRTIQTAEGLGRRFETHDDLAPGAMPQEVLQLTGWSAPSAMAGLGTSTFGASVLEAESTTRGESEPSDACVVIVGHQPTLGQVVGRLLLGQSVDWSVRKGSIWWFRRRASGVILRAMLTPDLANE